MSTQEDEVRLLIQNLQKCNNTNECINFDLASTIQEFLNSLDKNSFEDIDKTIRENEKDKDLMNSFTSAAIFLENCVKILGLKIEHLHNLAHNTLYNIYKENKNNNSNKKQLLIIDEEYLYINEIKNLKNTITENDIIEEDLLIKTIPLPTFLFTDHIKVKNKIDNHKNIIKNDEKDNSLLNKKKNLNKSDIENIPYIDTLENESITSIQKNVMDLNSEYSYQNMDNMDNMNSMENKQTLEISSVNSLNFDKLFLENDGIILLDINDYNIFINDEYDFTLQNKNSTILFEKYEFFSRNSIYLSNNLSEYIYEQNTIQHTYKINNIYDITSLRLCTDTLLFKTDFYSYDLALDVIKNKNYLINKFERQKNKLYILDETTHKNHKYNTIYKQNANYCDYCGSIIEPNESNNHCIYCNNNNEKNGFYKKLPGYYNLSCYNITETQDFLTYMQPNKIIDIIMQNEINDTNLDANSTTNKLDQNIIDPIFHENNDSSDKSDDQKLPNDPKLTNDQKLFKQIKIPPLYIQKLGLNIDYYYLEPLLYNLIKSLKKEKNVDRFFSINFYDHNENYDTEILKDDDYQEIKDEQNKTIQETLTMGTFINIKSIDNHVKNLPTSILKKTDSNTSLAFSFEDKIQDRVNKWRNFLEKKLDILKRQPPYNVEYYKKKILKYMISNGDNIYFPDLVNDNEKYKIYRNFLTTLMLINTNKLDITEIEQNNSNNITNYKINVKNMNVNEYINFPNSFDNIKFTINDKKRKITQNFDNKNDSLYLQKKHHI
ncbi:condensin-2 complex subunit H2, putative [Plasmodium yoelii]|uniref:Condensin-2 complex subunit H2 n=2 Tax=Plasmodium yoelii TaxID=5861 RepID=A0AAE9WJA4_PLAYO|nr:condensin-2 complex subunit H2, putative [Plasmodium yoelii]WBY54937.1 condensin-2 complex subunit H2 [Plasmodium yoelii yoelii]CDU16211.1 conserved Plasmodium protein, unknown function [Plasmodium yoelii]VTZ72380.1 condensin-2 complex subunit H2, putative [Plasmodium yoelii]|eukprot:XP_729479.2 condensin-2 complex subunit H2, putative [Plasmodium yoelii]